MLFKCLASTGYRDLECSTTILAFARRRDRLQRAVLLQRCRIRARGPAVSCTIRQDNIRGIAIRFPHWRRTWSNRSWSNGHQRQGEETTEGSRYWITTTRNGLGQPRPDIASLILPADPWRSRSVPPWSWWLRVVRKHGVLHIARRLPFDRSEPASRCSGAGVTLAW